MLRDCRPLINADGTLMDWSEGMFQKWGVGSREWGVERECKRRSAKDANGVFADVGCWRRVMEFFLIIA